MTPTRCRLDRGSPGQSWPGTIRHAWPALLLAISLLHPGLTVGQPPPGTGSSQSTATAEAQRRLEGLRRSFADQSTNVTVAWQLGRACFDRAELAGAPAEREALGLEGMRACRRGIELSPTNAASHYYLALNLGQVARIRRLSALKLVREMETELLATARLDAHLDHAGADRALALLYRDAPGWPVSVGNHQLARRHFQRSLTVEPDYPGNRMAWAEFLLGQGDWTAVREQVRQLEAGWEDARRHLAGPAWESSWREWQARLDRIQARLRERAATGRDSPSR
ncbi:MAG: hypothetical protein ACKO3N_10060 [Verrucomicrobiota bacterium]